MKILLDNTFEKYALYWLTLVKDGLCWKMLYELVKMPTTAFSQNCIHATRMSWWQDTSLCWTDFQLETTHRKHFRAVSFLKLIHVFGLSARAPPSCHFFRWIDTQMQWHRSVYYKHQPNEDPAYLYDVS